MREPGPSSCAGRRHLAVAAVLAAAAALVWRAADLQLTQGAFLQDQGERRHVRVVETPAYRGKILDRNRQPLAISTPVDSVWVDPREFDPQAEGIPLLADLLGIEHARLERQIAARAERRFVYLLRHVAPEFAERVRALRVPGVNLQREYRRYYPLGEVAGHVVGFTDVDERGREGVELAFESRIASQPGRERVLRDSLGRIVEKIERIDAPRPGEDIVLSLDAQIQYLAYRALFAGVREHRAQAGSAVVLDVRSGEVLAMVNQPSYNPNNRADRAGERMRNRAVTDVFEPGSTVKPFTVAAALESGRFGVGTTIDTHPGRFRIGRHTVRDVRDYGVIDLATLLRKSSNVAASRIALDLEPGQLWETFRRAGFGAAPASGFPGEVPGVLNHHERWRRIDRATLSFGYGLSVTALHLAQAYAAIANGGLLPALSFERVDAAGPGTRMMSATTSRQLRDMLEGVVTPDGTGWAARVPGYRVGGKTGTSRKSIANGYATDRYLALFAGIAPMSRPRLAIVVMVDEPAGRHYYGGQVAAPVFARIAQGALRVLAIAPDDHGVVTRRVHLGGDALLARLDVRGAPAGFE